MSEQVVLDRHANDLRVDRNVPPPHLLRLQQELLELVDLFGRRLDTPLCEPLVGDALGRADLHGGQGGYPDRAAQLFRRVDRARGLPAVVLGNCAQAGGVVDGEDDPEPQPLQQEAGHE